MDDDGSVLSLSGSIGGSVARRPQPSPPIITTPTPRGALGAAAAVAAASSGGGGGGVGLVGVGPAGPGATASSTAAASAAPPQPRRLAHPSAMAAWGSASDDGASAGFGEAPRARPRALRHPGVVLFTPPT